MLQSRFIRRGFTLIELLVVVAIISILSAIAVPNFLEAQTRSKVARTLADMRSLTTAIETYAIDHNSYPPRQPYPNPSLVTLPLGNSQTKIADLKRVTTPIAYISNIPKDVFETRLAPPLDTLDYWSSEILKWHDVNIPNKSQFVGQPPSPNTNRWLLVSVGPDTEMGHSGMQGNLPYSSTFGIFRHYRHNYDPTNGTLSFGNIYRGPNNESAMDYFPQ